MKKFLIAVAVCLSGLVSCEVAQNYAYRMTNNASDEVEVHVVSYGVDTLMTIPSGETRTVLVITHLSTITEKTKHSVALDLRECTVSKDGQLSTRDYLGNESWRYRDGVYMTGITDGEFAAPEEE